MTALILPCIILPWPDPALWPNSRKHRLAVAPIRAEQRRVAHALACEKGWHRLNAPSGVVEVNMTFCPPSRRVFDLSNALAAMKGAEDGLSDALHVDDRWFCPRIIRGETSKNGGVIIEARATGMPWKRIGDLASLAVAKATEMRAAE